MDSFVRIMIAAGDSEKVRSVNRVLEDTCGIHPISYATWFAGAVERIEHIEFHLVFLGLHMPRDRTGEIVQPIGYDLIGWIRKKQAHPVKVVGLDELSEKDAQQTHNPDVIISTDDMLQALPALIQEVKKTVEKFSTSV